MSGEHKLRLDLPDPPNFHSLPHPHQPQQNANANNNLNVFARLQSLFPAPHSQSALPSPVAGVVESPNSIHGLPPPPPKALKIRIITWNMHESLPKGDLTELLGPVTPYTPRLPLNDPHAFPYLPEDGEHPYHLVVVAGQECPGLSGLPMGLGAGFKLSDKEKKRRENREGAALTEEDVQREKDERERYAEGLRELQARLLKNESGNPEDAHAASATSGWTAILESWFCHGEPLPEHVHHHGHQGSPRKPPAPEHLERAFSTGDIRREPRTKGWGVTGIERKGPYEMLVKERMMGLYLCVFVHRDARHLVQGTSRGAVTAGLIGGRLGNKGGVGISLKLAGTSFLFLNAHLAAHDRRVPDRLANLAKIKAELQISDFLRADDPRAMSEDLTDRFDHTFLCGDLNFRLDLSRLHADWLISRGEFAQALQFDQLFNLMRNGQAFVGFNEAPINFPPTFKYDVLRTLKGKHGRRPSNAATSAKQSPPIPEAAEPRLSRESARSTKSSNPPRARSRSAQPSPENDGSSSSEEENDGATSLSTNASKRKDDRDSDSCSSCSDDIDEEAAANARAAAKSNKRPRELVRVISVKAARKAKAKFHELLSPSPRSPLPRTPGLAPRTPGVPPRTPGFPPTPSRSGTNPSSEGLLEPTPQRPASSLFSSPPILRRRANSTRSGLTTSGAGGDDSDAEADDKSRGVYDSSSKQRVPSWCDRILYKSTVRPPEPEPESLPQIPRTAVGAFIAHALRSFSAASSRARRASLASSITGPGTPSSILADDGTSSGRIRIESPLSSPLNSPTELPGSPPRSPPPSRPGSPRRRRQRPMSIDAGMSPPRPSTSSNASGRRLGLPRSQSTTGLDAKASSQSPPALVAPSPMPAVSSGVPVPRTMTLPSPRPSPPPAPGRAWRFLPFSSHAGPVSAGAVQQSPPVRRRRGEVICFSYRTLDDRGMRRLEGRSDHRPVIGSYAVYL